MGKMFYIVLVSREERALLTRHRLSFEFLCKSWQVMLLVLGASGMFDVSKSETGDPYFMTSSVALENAEPIGND